MNATNIRWEGSIFDNHSLAIVNCQFLYWLSENEDNNIHIISKDIKPKTDKWSVKFERLKRFYDHQLTHVDYHIAHQWPPKFDAPGDGKWILFQPWEYGPIPKTWVPHLLYEIDEIWVYSNFTKNGYMKSGIPGNKVHVFPLGFDPEIYNVDGNTRNLSTKKSVKFLFVGGTIWRKGIDVLLRSYLAGFTSADDVTLIIKDFGNTSFYAGQTQANMITEIQSNPASPEIIYIDQELTPVELAELYRSCDCLVHPYRGEGFGLPILEAMACGTPVMIPDVGPATEFTSEHNSIRVRSQVVAAEHSNVGDLELTSPLEYIQVDETDLMNSMRLAYRNKSELKELGRKATEDAHRNFTWEIVSNHLYDHIESSVNVGLQRQTQIQYMHEAMVKMQAGDMITSSWLWKKSLVENTMNLDAYFNLGYVNTVLNNPGEAISNLIKLKNNANYLMNKENIYFYLLAINYFKLMQYDNSRKNLNAAMQYGVTKELQELYQHVNQAINLLKMNDMKSKIENVAEWKKQIVKNRSAQFGKEKLEFLFQLFKQNDNVLYVSDNSYGDEGLYEVANALDIRLMVLRVDIENAEIQKYIDEKFSGKYDGVFVDRILEHMTKEMVLHVLMSGRKCLNEDGSLIVAAYNDKSEENETLKYAVKDFVKLEDIRKLLVDLEFLDVESGISNDQSISYVVSRKNPVEIIWESPLLNATGYATESKYFLEGLRSYNYKINLFVRENDSKELLYSKPFLDFVQSVSENKARKPLVYFQSVPAQYFLPPKAPISIGRSMFETDRIPEEWVYKCNQLLEIWVPSEFNKLSFGMSGVDPNKIHVIPGALDFDYYSRDKVTHNFEYYKATPDTFTFLSVFEWNFRKGWDILIKAYVEEFNNNEDVNLIIKTSTFYNVNVENEIKSYIHSLGISMEKAPQIKLINAHMTVEELKDLYAIADSFVLPTRGEGWGRPFMEAMAMEVPVIGTNWGGNTAFMTEDNSYLIDVEGLETIDQRMLIPFYTGHKWAVPSAESTKKWMRYVYEHKGEVQKKAKETREILKENFSTRSVARLVDTRLKELINDYLS